MTPPIVWTPEMDAALLQRRGAGEPWHAVSTALAIGRNSVINRARQLGVEAHPPAQRKATLASHRIGAGPCNCRTEDDPARGYGGYWSLPAGHSDSWAAITAGTTLQGEPFTPLRHGRT